MTNARKPAPILLAGGCIVTLDETRRILPVADLLIEGGRIVGTGRDLACPPRTERIDCTGCIVLPGLVQAHVHLCQTLLRGRADDAPLLEWLRGAVWPYEARLDAATLRAAVQLGAAELLLGGTTAVLDMGTVHGQDELFTAGAETGLRLTSGKAMMDKGEGVPDGLRETTEDSLMESERLAKAWHGAACGRLRYALAPRFALSCSERLLRETGALARRRGLLVHTHASENRQECAAVEAATGKRTVAYLEDLGISGRHAVLAHGVWLDEAERARLAAAGTHIVHCPGSNGKLASGIAPVPELLAAGVSVALGADGAACNNGLDVFSEMRAAVLLARARTERVDFGARQALELATRGGARALGLADEIGSLEPGKRGDVCVVDVRGIPQAPLGTTDPYSTVVFSCNARDVRDVFVGGHPVVRDRTLLTVNAGTVIARAQEAASRLFGTVGARLDLPRPPP